MYKRFSDIYDKLVFDIDYKKYSNNIFEILDKYDIKEGNILEIGCGTGNLTEKLAQNNNYFVQAFDFSEEMLNHAFTKTTQFNNVQIFKYDMYQFPYDNYQFDAIVSLLDVINYILEEDELFSLFKNIYSGIKEGGVFIFDLNSKYKLLNVLANNSFIYEYENIFYTWENYLEDDIVEFYLNFFVKSENGLYERIEENQIERYYSIEYIINLLEKVGFKDIKYIDEDGGEFRKNKTQRILFSAIK